MSTTLLETLNEIMRPPHSMGCGAWSLSGKMPRGVSTSDLSWAKGETSLTAQYALHNPSHIMDTCTEKRQVAGNSTKLCNMATSEDGIMNDFFSPYTFSVFFMLSVESINYFIIRSCRFKKKIVT